MEHIGTHPAKALVKRFLMCGLKTNEPVKLKGEQQND